MSTPEDAPAAPAALGEPAATGDLDARDRSQTSEDASARDWSRTDAADAPEDDAEDDAPEDDAPDDATPEDAAPEDVTTAGEPDRTTPGAPQPPAPTSDAPAGSPASAEPDVPGDPDQPPAQEERRQVVRATGPPRRPRLLVQGLWPVALAGALALATTLGLLPLAAAVLCVQVFLVLGALALLDAPAAGGAFVVAVAASVAADALVLTDEGRVGGLAGAVALGLVASLVHQLTRTGRSRVTESLADTLVVVVVAVAAACLLALQQADGGEQVLLVSLAAAGAVLLAGRVGDALAPRPVLAVGATRGWPGLVLGLGGGVAGALLVADAGGALPLRSAALLGLVVAATVATADLAVDLGAAELRSGWRDARRVAALRPTALLLPYALLGPVALLAGRLVLS